MDRHPISLRAANPTLDEGLAFAQRDHDLSYQYVTFAERDNVIVGMFLGYTAEQHSHSSRQPLIQAAGRRNIRMRIVMILFAPLMRITDSIADGDFYLQFIAVDKALRGDGVGSVLIDSFEERARASGSIRISLDVSAKNEGAHRFYERRGMTVE